ncbi:MAG TPA: GxxExxY protein [Thermodesulfobacteriota bacterium]|nr:GxxExxY protein [Thermodesulfobacteriota bacterium]
MAQEMPKEKRDSRTYSIIGAAMEVHRQLGCGFLESVYQEAMALEMTGRGIPYGREVEIPVFYKNQRLNTSFRADFLCFDLVIVELKALGSLSGIEEAQLINYLKATGYEVGLLFNFGAASLEHRRLAFSKPLPSIKSA